MRRSVIVAGLLACAVAGSGHAQGQAQGQLWECADRKGGKSRMRVERDAVVPIRPEGGDFDPMPIVQRSPGVITYATASPMIHMLNVEVLNLQTGKRDSYAIFGSGKAEHHALTCKPVG